MRGASEPIPARPRRSRCGSVFIVPIILVCLLPATSRAGPPIWLLARSLDARLRPAPPAIALDSASPGTACRAAIAAQEPLHGIPPHLLAAIGRVESGRPNDRGGVDPWPWSIDVEGTDHVYDTEAEAIAAVRSYQAEGARSIDVGCMQINLMFHPDAFISLEQAFDPQSNAAYAAQLLVQLHAQTGNWTTATAWYHSATPALGTEYARRVMAALPAEQAHMSGTMPAGILPVAMALPAAAAPSAGPYMLSATAVSRRLPGAAAAVGRGLAAYRALPVRVTSVVALH